MNANIYTRNYMPEKERTEVSVLKEHQAMLKKTLFNEKEPTKKYYLRPNIQNLDQRTRLRFKAASPTMRVQEQINKQHRANYETFDLWKTEVQPDFKTYNEKQKWLTKDGFSTSYKIGHNGSPVTAVAWRQ